MDRIGLTGPGNEIVSVKARARYKVVIKLKAPDSQFIAATMNRVFIVPKHVWSKVNKVATFFNSRPVGSGPFNRITRFTAQDYVLSKNPHYWQQGKPKIHASSTCRPRRTTPRSRSSRAGRSTGRTTSCRTSTRRTRTRTRSTSTPFYATTAYPVSLMNDTTKYPYSMPAFRKALSRAIDRKTVSKLGEYGYAPPTDAIGLNGLFPSGSRTRRSRPARRPCPRTARRPPRRS
jgi:peptide/nickel transport system substrate-binding protein